jgi:hypothetical protein
MSVCFREALENFVGKLHFTIDIQKLKKRKENEKRTGENHPPKIKMFNSKH